MVKIGIVLISAMKGDIETKRVLGGE